MKAPELLGIAVSAGAVILGWRLVRGQRSNLGAAWTYFVPKGKEARQKRSCVRSASREARPRTYKVKNDAVQALLEANPKLRQFIESDCGRDCSAYTAWVNHGRRGPKPRARHGDGRFDALNEMFERRTPAKKIASWREALAVTAPTSRHWEDMADRLPALEDAVGFGLNLPERSEAVLRARKYIERCEDVEEERVPF